MRRASPPLTLNRPQARNALSDALIDALTGELDAIAADRASAPSSCRARARFLRRPRPQGDDAPAAPTRTGAAPISPTSCALLGHDAADRAPAAAGDRGREGIATAAGCQLVATCDLAVAGAEARSARPASTSACSARRRWSRSRATSPASTPWRCCSSARWCGRGRAPHRPRQPRRAGGRGDAEARAARRGYRGEIAADREDRQARVLRAARDGPRRSLRPRLAVMVENMLARDAEEGIGAFLEKRAPVWEGR